MLAASLMVRAAARQLLLQESSRFDNDALGLPDEVCDPFHNFSSPLELCAYALQNDDACEGGGYLRWTEYALCTDNASLRWTVWIPLAVLVMLWALILLGTATDEYLCTSISSIVNQLKISQNVAGVTLMAFGNGAPDIFGMLVEVVAAESPKADLALGQLLGGGMFVTTVVVAAIILHKPFKVMRRPILRDLFFYLVALAFLLFVVLYDDRMYYWQPLVLLVLYMVYALIVILGSSVRKGKILCFRWKDEAIVRKSTRRRTVTRQSVLGGHFVELTITTAGSDDGVAVTMASGSPSKVSPVGGSFAPKSSFNAGLLSVDTGINKHRSTSTLSRRSNITIVPVGEPDDEDSVIMYKDHGRFFADEPDADDSSASSVAAVDEVLDEVTSTSSGSPKSSYGTISPIAEASRGFLAEKLRCWRGAVGTATRKWYHHHIKHEAWHVRIVNVLRLPCQLLLWATTPNTTCEWSKYTAVLHCITSPVFCLLAFGLAQYPPFEGGPGLYAYVLAASALLALATLLFTRTDRSPWIIQYIQPYTSFVVSVAWVYALAAEIVNVVMMIGVVSQVSHVVLGLTVLAWSNSLGDIVADLAVARQGFPRMAISAAIGGPLLNLLMGYGLSFLIACFKNTKPIQIERANPKKLMMIFFLCASLISTAIILFAQRFHARRFHAFVLIALYVVFIALVLLHETGFVRF